MLVTRAAVQPSGCRGGGLTESTACAIRPHRRNHDVPEPFNEKDNSMISLASRRAVLPWLPVGFCAALSVITICQNLRLTVINHTDIGGWAIVFLCFLPMCFVFVGMGMFEMRREISELRKQVAELRDKNPLT
jgi:hypothetical protein